MKAWLSIESLSLAPSGSTLSLELGPRQILAIFGPSGSGKSKLLRTLAGEAKPGRGQVRRFGRHSQTGSKGVSAKITPQAIAKSANGAGAVSRVVEVLTALGLWDCRAEPVSSLPPGKQAGCELISALISPADLLFVDGHLDRLDPWAEASAADLVLRRVAQGSALAIASSRADWAPRSQHIVVMDAERFRFQGSFEELQAQFGRSEVEIEAIDRQGVRALSEPFALDVREREDSMTLHTREGQGAAARLLAEGYGQVKAVCVRELPPDEVIRSVLRPK